MSRMLKSRNARTGIKVLNSKGRGGRFHLTGRQILLVMVILAVSMGTGIGYVWSNFERTQIGYDLSQMEKEERRLEEINLKLRLEIATLKSPQHLESLATRILGLRKPSPEQIVVLP